MTGQYVIRYAPREITIQGWPIILDSRVGISKGAARDQGGICEISTVYYSAAVAAKNDLDIIRFPASVNLSDSIQNAASVPGTARNEKEAIDFIKFLLSTEGQNILIETGQPPVVPAIRKGSVPAELN